MMKIISYCFISLAGFAYLLLCAYANIAQYQYPEWIAKEFLILQIPNWFNFLVLLVSIFSLIRGHALIGRWEKSNKYVPYPELKEKWGRQ